MALANVLFCVPNWGVSSSGGLRGCKIPVHLWLQGIIERDDLVMKSQMAVSEPRNRSYSTEIFVLLLG